MSSEVSVEFHDRKVEEKSEMESKSAVDPSPLGMSTSTVGPVSYEPTNLTSVTNEQYKSVNYTSFVRFCMYIFFVFYLIFALLILFSGRVDLVHKEHLITEVAQLDMEELTIQKMFIMNALFLSVAATIGLFAFYYHKYTLFLSFSLGLMFTMIFAMVSLKYSYNAYSQMDRVLDHNETVSAVFDTRMARYDWRDYRNATSEFINKFQNEFRCCGGSGGYKDWVPLKPADVPAGAFPVSCCVVHFDVDLDLDWCGYQEVETKASCPKAFITHLESVQNTFRTQVMLLFEICLTQVLTVAVFFFLICRGERMFAAHRS